MTTKTIDPIALEVLRHRLWMINDEQGKVATRTSASPVVYESKDFNSSILTPEGDGLFVGLYTTRLSLCLSTAAKYIMQNLSENPGIDDGDAFVTNDPWAGAVHMNDILMAAPVMWEGELVAWTGIAMHEVDVGGPNPGSFTVGAPDVFGEAPLIPPVKLVEKGQVRADIESWVVRNTRTPDLNALNLRSRLAAINRTTRRIHEIIREWGKDTFMACQQGIIDVAHSAFQNRLRSLPDGTWAEEGFLDHDGNTNRTYRIRVVLTKQADRLTFDFRGTDPQAIGTVNCTRVGLESGVVSAVLPALCYDMSWTPAALLPFLEILSDEGTINNASYPAGVSMATVAATYATQHVASMAIAKMLACSDLKDEAQANWTPSWVGTVMDGTNQAGKRFTTVLLDQAGGGGARTWKDGVDTGGMPGSPGQGIGNVETYERMYPLLYLYRKQAADTGGAGRYRGGVGTESLIIPYKVGGSIDLTVLCHGAGQPEARGLYGGYPSSVHVRILLRGTDVHTMLASGRIPVSPQDINAEMQEVLLAKQRTKLGPNDAMLVACAGGGGYGDPIRREPAAVASDVIRNLVSIEQAVRLYGVAIDESGAVDMEQTKRLREVIIAERLAAAIGPAAKQADNRAVEKSRILSRVGDAYIVVDGDEGPQFQCAVCHHSLGPVSTDPKHGLGRRDVPIADASSWNRYGNTEEFVCREYFCPSCATLTSVEVRKVQDPVLYDTQLGVER